MSILHFCPRILVLAGVLACCAVSVGSPSQMNLHLLPMPESLVLNEGRLNIDNTFSLQLSGHVDERIQAAAVRFLSRLRQKTGIPISERFNTDSSNAVMEIHCEGTGEAIQSPRADESYTLEAVDKGARLEAPSPIGIIRGLETFLQLINADETSFFVPALVIRDKPRFCWRGLLIDVSRHWEPVEIIKKNLDAMAVVKMNVLHWHLSDDQGFRVESRHFPKLHEIASEGNYYTQQEVREIVAYARDRGIRIIPEFDMPGHTTAWLAAYPELASAPGPYFIERSWGVLDPSMDPTSKKLYDFLNSFVDEMARLFPDEYFHIGGDEVNGRQWNANPDIQAFKAQNNLPDNPALQAYFNQRLQHILERHHKKMIGWDEILHPGLPKSAVVQSWRGHSFLAKGARQGYAGILSYGYYLDHMRPASFHYGNDPLGKEAANLSDQEKALVLGGEACMWAEFVNSDNIESRIWPRTAAIAERLWSPRDVTDVRDLYRRLEYISGELNTVGVRPRTRQMVMLQRMAGVENAASLKMLADLLNPTGLSVRVRTKTYSSLVPLNRMVDAVLPESDVAGKFGEMVSDVLSDPSSRPENFRTIRKLLSTWKDNADALKSVVVQSFLIKEIEPLTEFMSEFIETGLQALNYIESRQKPPEEWIAKAASTLARAEKPQAEMLIAIAPHLKRIIEAAGTMP